MEKSSSHIEGGNNVSFSLFFDVKGQLTKKNHIGSFKKYQLQDKDLVPHKTKFEK